MDQVVDNEHVLHVSVRKNSQVFDKEPVFGLHAVLSAENVVENFFVRV
jgi:hypothetical protein